MKVDNKIFYKKPEAQ